MFNKLKHLLPNVKGSVGPKIIFIKILYKIYDLFFQQKIKNKKNINYKITSWKYFSISTNKLLYNETENFYNSHLKIINNKLQKIPFKMGGSAGIKLCYFFTRLIDAKNIVETGVAAGHSSRSFLIALKKNNSNGLLYSSDLPYLEHNNSIRFIGILVENKFREKWILKIGNDIDNLKKIIKRLDYIDIFHYDSDKSYLGRKLALEVIKCKLSNKSIIIMDDIQDNNFFYDYVKTNSLPYLVFKVDSKLVGVASKNKELWKKTNIKPI